MAWEDQGRQRHGWFGHGTSGALIDHNDRATQKRLSSGAAIAAMSAYEYLLHQRGQAVADAFNLAKTIPALKALVPIWAGGAHLQPSPFRETAFGKDFDPVTAWKLQLMVRDLIQAHAVAAEQAAGEDLAAAVRGIGVTTWQRFLEAAQDRVEILHLRQQYLQLKAKLDASKAAAVAKTAASAPGPRPDGSGDRITPVYPVETALGIGAAGVAEGAFAAARVVGGAILRQVMPDGKPLAVDTDTPPSVAPNAEGPLTGANFAQRDYSPFFNQRGRFAGKSVEDVAQALRSGLLTSADVPVEYIVRDGNKLILNTRSARALEQAGIPRGEWSAIDKTGDAAAEARLSGQLRRNDLTNQGIPTVTPRK